jgi:hypothetical protein
MVSTQQYPLQVSYIALKCAWQKRHSCRSGVINEGEHGRSYIVSAFWLTHRLGIGAHHEIYEDLGIHSHSVLDQSFNVNNFGFLDLSLDHPGRASAFECALTGTVRTLPKEQRVSSSRTSSTGIHPTLSSSSSASPNSLAFQASIATTKEQQDAHWLGENVASMASLNAQCSAAGESIYDCAKVGLQSFSSLDEQKCPRGDDFLTPAMQERIYHSDGEAALDASDFRFPSWDQLPKDLQNPTTSADFCSTIPLGTTATSIPGLDSSAGDFIVWDNDDMNFTMDMDLDMDLNMNVLETS